MDFFDDFDFNGTSACPSSSQFVETFTSSENFTYNSISPNPAPSTAVDPGNSAIPKPPNAPPRRLPNGRFMSKAQLEMFQQGVSVEEIMRLAAVEEAQRKKAEAEGLLDGIQPAPKKKKKKSKKPAVLKEESVEPSTSTMGSISNGSHSSVNRKSSKSTSIGRATSNSAASNYGNSNSNSFARGGNSNSASTTHATSNSAAPMYGNSNPEISTSQQAPSFMVPQQPQAHPCIQIINGQPVIQARLERIQAADGTTMTVAVIPADIQNLLRASGLTIPSTVQSVPSNLGQVQPGTIVQNGQSQQPTTVHSIQPRPAMSSSPNPNLLLVQRSASSNIDQQRYAPIQPKIKQRPQITTTPIQTVVTAPQPSVPQQLPMERFTFRLSSEDEKAVADLTNQIARYQSIGQRTPADESALEKLEQQRTAILHQAASNQFRALSNTHPNGTSTVSYGGSALQTAQIPNEFSKTVPRIKKVEDDPSVIMELRKERLKAQLEADQERVTQPDCATPFRDQADLSRRLLAYHLYDEPNVNEKLLAAVDSDFRSFMARCKKRMRGIYDRFFEIHDTVAPFSTSMDSLMVNDLMLRDDKQSFDEERELASNFPDLYVRELKANDESSMDIDSLDSVNDGILSDTHDGDTPFCQNNEQGTVSDRYSTSPVRFEPIDSPVQFECMPPSIIISNSELEQSEWKSISPRSKFIESEIRQVSESSIFSLAPEINRSISPGLNVINTGAKSISPDLRSIKSVSPGSISKSKSPIIFRLGSPRLKSPSLSPAPKSRLDKMISGEEINNSKFMVEDGIDGKDIKKLGSSSDQEQTVGKGTKLRINLGDGFNKSAADHQKLAIKSIDHEKSIIKSADQAKSIVKSKSEKGVIKSVLKEFKRKKHSEKEKSIADSPLESLSVGRSSEIQSSSKQESMGDERIEARISVKVIIKKRRLEKTDDQRPPDVFMGESSKGVNGNLFKESDGEETLRVPPLKIRLKCKKDEKIVKWKRNRDGIRFLGLDSSDSEEEEEQLSIDRSAIDRQSDNPSVIDRLSNQPSIDHRSLGQSSSNQQSRGQSTITHQDQSIAQSNNSYQSPISVNGDDDENSATSTSPGDSGQDEGDHGEDTADNSDQGQQEGTEPGIPRLKLFRSSNLASIGSGNGLSISSVTSWRRVGVDAARHTMDNEASDDDEL